MGSVRAQELGVGPPLGARSAARFMYILRRFLLVYVEASCSYLGVSWGRLGGGPGALGGALGRLGASRGHLGGIVEELEGARRGARPVFYEYFCESVLLLEIEEKHEQKRWSNFMS